MLSTNVLCSCFFIFLFVPSVFLVKSSIKVLTDDTTKSVPHVDDLKRIQICYETDKQTGFVPKISFKASLYEQDEKVQEHDPWFEIKAGSYIELKYLGSIKLTGVNNCLDQNGWNAEVGGANSIFQVGDQDEWLNSSECKKMTSQLISICQYWFPLPFDNVQGPNGKIFSDIASVLPIPDDMRFAMDLDFGFTSLIARLISFSKHMQILAKFMVKQIDSFCSQNSTVEFNRENQGRYVEFLTKLLSKPSLLNKFKQMLHTTEVKLKLLEHLYAFNDEMNVRGSLSSMVPSTVYSEIVPHVSFVLKVTPSDGKTLSSDEQQKEGLIEIESLHFEMTDESHVGKTQPNNGLNVGTTALIILSRYIKLMERSYPILGQMLQNERLSMPVTNEEAFDICMHGFDKQWETVKRVFAKRLYEIEPVEEENFYEDSLDEIRDLVFLRWKYFWILENYSKRFKLRSERPSHQQESLVDTDMNLTPIQLNKQTYNQMKKFAKDIKIPISNGPLPEKKETIDLSNLTMQDVAKWSVWEVIYSLEQILNLTETELNTILNAEITLSPKFLKKHFDVEVGLEMYSFIGELLCQKLPEMKLRLLNESTGWYLTGVMSANKEKISFNAKVASSTQPSSNYFSRLNRSLSSSPNTSNEIHVLSDHWTFTDEDLMVINVFTAGGIIVKATTSYSNAKGVIENVLLMIKFVSAKLFDPRLFMSLIANDTDEKGSLILRVSKAQAMWFCVFGKYPTYIITQMYEYMIKHSRKLNLDQASKWEMFKGVKKELIHLDHLQACLSSFEETVFAPVKIFLEKNLQSLKRPNLKDKRDTIIKALKDEKK